MTLGRVELHDDPPGWLRKHNTKASFAFIALGQGTFTECEHVTDALINEVGILSPGTRPAEPLARVLSLRPLAATATPDRDTAGEDVVFYGGGPYSGGVITRRTTRPRPKTRNFAADSTGRNATSAAQTSSRS